MKTVKDIQNRFQNDVTCKLSSIETRLLDEINDAKEEVDSLQTHFDQKLLELGQQRDSALRELDKQYQA